MIKFLLVFGSVFLVLELIFFVLAVKVFKLPSFLFWGILSYSFFAYLFFVFQVFSYDRSIGPSHSFYWGVGFMVLHVVPKLIVILFLIVSYLVMLVVNVNASAEVIQGRRKFIGKLGLGIAALPLVGIIHGLWKGKYNFKVIKKQLFFADLPKAFDGFKILQISDLHSGSFDDADKIKYAIDLINKQEADLFLFTGDIVNTKAEEFHPWLTTFNKLKEFPHGKFSVLGNHDYGEYVTWPSDKAKQDNFESIKGLHKQVNFDLLCNENRTIKKGEAQIQLIGVENWGKNFKKAGDLKLASEGLVQNDFKVLMSHDPSHWEYEVKAHPMNYQLTLSGHTHGLQFGIEIPGIFKWSPIQYVYKQWAGIYAHADRYINVNRGFGFHAFPGRVGIWPEISILELKRKV
ncbi:metallophosphoesterase [Aquimarina agarilytica]|uniref:metallophosphoesterase n=1 Tax=Aquimarina agarilytica TaxID=1087449 RepID=UPI000288FEAA|nr:metallophosphoesterase [Aquimarina agarilytica]